MATFNQYNDASVDALVAATAGAGLPELGGYPLIKLLQKNSSSKELSLPGAAVGRFLFTATEQVAASFVAQPIGWRYYWMEWLAGRGGPAGQHPKRPDNAVKFRNPETSRDVWRTPDGNSLEETIDLVLIVDGVTWGFPHKSTALKVLRNEIFIPLKQRSVILADGRRVHPPALFHCKLTVTAQDDSNSFGDWKLPSYEIAGLYREPKGPSPEEIRYGAKASQPYGLLQESALELLNGPEPPAPPPEPAQRERGKMTVTTGPRAAETAPPRQEAPPPRSEDDYGGRRGPPIDLNDDDRPPF
jgi:hypothetical protein